MGGIRGNSCLSPLGGLAIFGGVLFAFAWPRFAMYGCKAHQLEPKVQLGKVHAAEVAFHARTGSYTTDLVALGLVPAPDRRREVGRRYVFGFAVASSGGEPHVSSHPDALGREHYAGQLTSADTALPVDTTASADEFRAAAVGNLDDNSVAPGRLDIWTIDQTGALDHRVDDCEWSWSRIF